MHVLLIFLLLCGALIFILPDTEPEEYPGKKENNRCSSIHKWKYVNGHLTCTKCDYIPGKE